MSYVLSAAEALDSGLPCNHAVQLYGSNERALARHVSKFLGEGYQRGDVLLMIATPEHSRLIVERLESTGLDTAKMSADGRFGLFDAQATLDRFMKNGYPDPARFDRVVGTVVRDARERAAAMLLRRQPAVRTTTPRDRSPPRRAVRL